MTEQTDDRVAEPVTQSVAETVEAPPLPGSPPQLLPIPLPPAKVKKDRRVLRAALRWTAAVVVFAAVGAGTAYGITGMTRTDVPGLETASDGRWDYPEITRPPLPSGSPAPFSAANKGDNHYADLRALLLPAPKGAKADRELRGEDGWLPTKGFLAQYAEQDSRDALRQLLTDNALRHIAARGWRTQDGTSTRIYLLQFKTAAVVDDLLSSELTGWGSPKYALSGAPRTERDTKFPGGASVDSVDRDGFTETRPYGAEQVRQAYLGAGDTLALVVQSRKGGARAVPFQQTVTLQSELLG